MALKLYPLGIQTFSEIRKRDMLYIDKTEYVYRMASSGKFFFLSRPRRFGKSLLVSTLKSYFEGKKELFRGLALEQLEKEWTEYPVLHFDMSTFKNCDLKDLQSKFNVLLSQYESIWGKGPESKTPGIAENTAEQKCRQRGRTGSPSRFCAEKINQTQQQQNP